MFEIQYYRTIEGKCPLEDYLDDLSDRQVEKVLWTLRVVRELNPVPAQYLQKMSGASDLWEVRISYAGNIFRLLGFGKRRASADIGARIYKENAEDSGAGNDHSSDKKKGL